MVSAYSIGTAKRGDLGNSGSRYVPGPGAYNADKKQKKVPPSWKIGSEERQGFQGNRTPGPGSYQHKQRIGEGAKYSIALKNPAGSSVMRNPGPGAYNPKQYDSKKANPPNYSMGLKTSQGGILGNQSKVPGPGSYERRSTVLNRPSSKFGTGQRTNLTQTEKTPGPGTYLQERPNSAITKYIDSRYQDGPRFGFGTQMRDSFQNSRKTPGPGTYNLKSSIELERGVTMISRRYQNDPNRVPGPGAYNPDKKQKKVPPAYKIGTGGRSQLSQSQLVPGPGTYSSNLSHRPKSPNYRIGTDVRRPLSGNSATPGVGTYNFPQKREGPKYSMKGNVAQDPLDKERSSVPGPGSYKPSVFQTKQRPASAKIGTSNRPGLRNQGWVPGPGLYNLRTAQQGPRWGIGTSNRSDFKDNKVPGVGSYKLKPYFADVPHYLLASSTKI